MCFFLCVTNFSHLANIFKVVVVVQSLSCVRLFATPLIAACQASLYFTISRSLLKLMSIESLMPSNHLILSRPLSFCPQSFPGTGSFPISRLFTWGGQSIGASVSASVLPMNIPTMNYYLAIKRNASLTILCNQLTNVLQDSRPIYT